MNYPILMAGVLIFLALLAHLFIGSREALSTRPASPLANVKAKADEIERHWVQSLCAFQMVSVDLGVLSVLLLVVGATDRIPGRSTIAMIAAGVVSLWGVAWLLQLLALRRPVIDYVKLPQWILWFVCTGLLWWGANLS